MTPNERDAVEILRKAGWGLIPPAQFLTDTEPEFKDIWKEISSFTMTSPERGYALYSAVKYLVENRIPGDFIECGVWKGGSCLLMIRTLQSLGVSDRILRLYDTFAGMTEPDERDLIHWNGVPVKERWKEHWWEAGIDEVQRRILRTGYPEACCRFIPGAVEETLKSDVPEGIALLRLDTDWYASTRAELEHLYHRIHPGGVLIIDDYGHFRGAREATDEFLQSLDFKPLLCRPDYTGRVLIKPGL